MQHVYALDLFSLEEQERLREQLKKTAPHTTLEKIKGDAQALYLLLLCGLFFVLVGA